MVCRALPPCIAVVLRLLAKDCAHKAGANTANHRARKLASRQPSFKECVKAHLPNRLDTQA